MTHDPGLYHNVDFEKYLTMPGVSQSQLKTALERSPLHAIHSREATPAMRLGTDVHALLLQPDVFSATYIVAPPEAMLTDKGTPSASPKATKAYKDFVAANPDSVVLLPEEFERLQRIYCSVRNHPMARLLLDNCETEVTALWLDEETRVRCRARFDMLYHEEGIAVLPDLKTCADASDRAARKSIQNHGYYVQAAFYLDGARACGLPVDECINPFVFVFVETAAPYACRVVGLDAEAIRAGREYYRRGLRLWRQSQEANHWPGYPDLLGEESVGLDPWKMREIEEQ